MRFRIGGYLWLLNSAMILMLVCIAVYSVFHLVQIHIALKEITYKDLPLTKLVSEVVEAQLEQSVRLERITRLRTLGVDAGVQDRVAQAEGEFRQYDLNVKQKLKDVHKIAERIIADPKTIPRTRANFEQVKTTIEDIKQQYFEYIQEAVDLLDPKLDRDLAAREREVAEMEQERDDLDNAVTTLLGQIEGFAFGSAREATVMEYKALQGVTILSLVSALLALLIGVRIYRAIVPALRRAIGFAGAVAAGERGTRLQPGKEDTVETARLLASLDEMLQSVVQVEGALVESREALRFQATYDALTGLWNRRVLLENLGKELARAKREQTQLSIAIVDLDHFKRINDEYGHLAGDAILSEAARRMSESVREYDGVGRYGGEEFMLVMPGADKRAAIEVAERVRLALSESPIEAEGQMLSISASLGVTSSGGEESVEAITGRADAALYTAKGNGRNQSCYEAGAS